MFLTQVPCWQAEHFILPSGKHCISSRCLGARGLSGRTRHSLSKVRVSGSSFAAVSKIWTTYRQFKLGPAPRNPLPLSVCAGPPHQLQLTPQLRSSHNNNTQPRKSHLCKRVAVVGGLCVRFQCFHHLLSSLLALWWIAAQLLSVPLVHCCHILEYFHYGGTI